MRLRVRFTKQGKIRFLSHRDLARVWERGLRRAAIPVAYSEGFSPRPRLSFGLALSTGYESLGEYLDIDLAPDAGVGPDDLPARVSPHLPPGMEATAAIPLPPGTDSLQQAVTSCDWQIEVVGPSPEQAAARVAEALAAPVLPVVVERKGTKTEIDARPAVLDLRVAAPPAPQPGVSRLHPTAVLEATLATQPRSLRPAELLRALDATWHEARAVRTHQWTLVDGARCEPIPVGDLSAGGATSPTHAGARAS
jgi:radical SAM-linked protein